MSQSQLMYVLLPQNGQRPGSNNLMEYIKRQEIHSFTLPCRCSFLGSYLIVSHTIYEEISSTESVCPNSFHTLLLTTLFHLLLSFLCYPISHDSLSFFSSFLHSITLDKSSFPPLLFLQQHTSLPFYLH